MISSQGCRGDPHLVGQVAAEVWGLGVVKAEGEAGVAVAEEDHVGHGAGDEQVGANVELLPVQQQRVLDVPGGQVRAEHRASLDLSLRIPPPGPGRPGTFEVRLCSDL